IGFIMLSSFSVTVVYAQMLVPGKIGTVSGLITGLAFGLGGVGALVLGNWIDKVGITHIMFLCGFFPLLGILTFLLPTDKTLNRWAEENGAEV
ncbi:MFS transporter, partial [Paenibacillus sp. EKM208P]